jgi:NAD(P)-dependent dehydrogenase (short-subunit alcohol dehydrogenase family)
VAAAVSRQRAAGGQGRDRTGAYSGIGRAVAVLFAREGAKVAVAYLCEHDDAQETRRLIEAEGSEALILSGDLGDPAIGQKLVDETIAKWGRLDVLVNNAGEQHPDHDIRDITVEQFQRTFQTNIFSMFYLVQAARTSNRARRSSTARR